MDYQPRHNVLICNDCHKPCGKCGKMIVYRELIDGNLCLPCHHKSLSEKKYNVTID